MLDFVNCKHCAETGTCARGAGGTSCARCRAHWLEHTKQYVPKDVETGLVCSVCWGKGVTEPTSSKWQNRFTPVLASSFVALAFLLIFVVLIFKTEHLEKVLVFAGTLIGTITGFYFGGERSTGSLLPKPSGAANGPTTQNPATPTVGAAGKAGA